MPGAVEGELSPYPGGVELKGRAAGGWGGGLKGSELGGNGPHQGGFLPRGFVSTDAFYGTRSVADVSRGLI